MDAIVSAALEEICARGAGGIPLPELWPALHAALAASGLACSDAVKQAVWARLLALPTLRFEARGRAPLGPRDPSIQSLVEAERLGLSVVAVEQLRDNFLGLYDLNAAGTEIPPIQRRALERLAAARTNGITQSELAKEFGIKGNNIFYIVRNLEYQQLIVRQSTIVRAKESGMDGENGLKNTTSTVHTNLMHLYRYAKNMSFNSQQKIEITRPDMLESLGDVDGGSLAGDGASGECVKEDVCVKDFLPAMRAVCEKLEVANGKVLVVSDIKVALGYRKTPGHRAWRNILNRLKDASLVEEFQAKVNNRVVSCLRLLKKFDPQDFQRKTTTYGSYGFGKRGQITDQLFELPIDHRIYDMIDAEGPKGITISEICKRLGLSAKRTYTRIIGMCSRFGVHVQAEIHNRTAAYRVWTSINYQHYSTNIFPDSSEVVPDRNDLSTKLRDLVSYDQSSQRDLISYDQSSQDIHLLSSTSDILHPEKTHSGEIELETPSTCSRHSGDAQVILSGTRSKNIAGEFTNVDDTELSNATRVTESNALSSKGSLSISSTMSKNQTLWRYQQLASTVVGERREQRILERLKNEKFILTAELHRWLEGLEKDKPTTMARRTLNRILNKLQQEGLCKCIQVSMPVVTNFSRTRLTEVILHPSLGNLSSELLDLIYKRQRHFDIETRGGSARKNDQSVTELEVLKQSSDRIGKPVVLEAMRSNGFVSAKMVRVKLLHNFLWGYLSSLPNWHNAFNSREHDCNPENPQSTRHMFALSAAIKAMPLELFLQVIGSAKAIDGMLEHCRLGLRLLDLPVQEYKCLMDTYATGRLSSIIDILLRLKLIQLANKGFPEDVNLLPHAVLTHAVELKPYIEEPLPRAVPSSNVNVLDLHPRIRHDFILSKQDAVDAYWDTLEYCYAAADPATASHAFPGSAVHEIFRSRSWTSVRVMSAEQRMELRKRVGNDRPRKKLSFKECVKIAKELDLTVEQVLRVYYYDRQRSRLRNFPISSESKEQENNRVAKKRKRNGSLKRNQADNNTRESNTVTMSTFDADDQNIGRTSTENHDIHMQASNDNNCVNAAVESGPYEEDGENAFTSQCDFPSVKSTRRKKFLWTDNSDRQLVMQYARYRATVGARFYRVDWTSLSDLPAHPNICRRRMTLLNSNGNIRRSVLRLCNLLGERFARYLGKTSTIQEKGILCRDDSGQSNQDVRFEESSATQESTYTIDSQLYCWDDFEDPNIKMAVDEVLRYKRMAKLEYPKRVGSRDEKEWPDITPTDENNLDAQECVTLKIQDEVSAGPGDGTPSCIGRRYQGISSISATVQNKSSSHQPHRKFLKLLNRRGIRIRRQVCESLAVANAIELLKLVFLNTSSEPEVQASLAVILQLYSECDLFEAFNYLREKNFMVIGHGSRPFVLSQKFWHHASSSPFPIDSGKRASNFSSWLHKQEKELKEDGAYLTSDLQCGESFHLFALVSLGELFISPCLPKKGIGEADEPKSLKPLLAIEDISEVDQSKSLKRKFDNGKMSSGEKFKKKIPQGKIDTDFCSRREKGFPGIKVLLNHATTSRDAAVQCLTDKEKFECFLSYEEKSQRNSVETIGIPSLSSELNACINSYSNNQPALSQNESLWDAMTNYATLLSSTSLGTNEVITFSPEVFKSVHSAIQQAGEQGLNMKEISKAVDIQGVQAAEIVIGTFEVFRLAIKVNSYDSIRIVDSSYGSKYFINMVADRNQDHHLSYMKSQVKHDGIYNAASMNLSDRHKVTFLNLPKEPARTQTEIQSVEGDITFDKCMQSEAAPVHRNEVGNKEYPAIGARVSLPILPWINGDGSTNTIVYKGLTRRVLGIVMQNPGILEEDIICRMDVLNPQTCRQLLESMILDNHIITRMMRQNTIAAPPTILASIFIKDFKKLGPGLRRHYFANPMSTCLL